MEITKYVGASTVAKMKTTRIHMFARLLSEILYSLDVVGVKPSSGETYWTPFRVAACTPDGDRRVVIPLQVYVGGTVDAKDEPFLCGSGNHYANVRKVLTELMHECEALALKEVT